MKSIEIYDVVVGNITAGIKTTTNAVTDTITVGTSDPGVAVTPAVPVVTTATAKLAATGLGLLNPSWFVVALFGLGGGVLLVRRRRKTQTQSWLTEGHARS